MQSTIEYAPRAEASTDLIRSSIEPFDSTISLAMTSESEARLQDRRRRERLAQLVGVRQVSVVRESEVAQIRTLEQRLRVDHDRRAGRRIARVADRDVAAELAEDIFVEDGAEQAHLLVRADRSAVGCGDARGLLSAVLERIQREEREAGCVASRREDPRYPAHPASIIADGPGETALLSPERASRRKSEARQGRY